MHNEICIKLIQTWMKSQMAHEDWVFAEVFSGIIIITIMLEATEHFHQCSGGKSNFATTVMVD